MKKYTLIILSILFFAPIHFFGQNQAFINQQNQYRAQRNQVFVTNVLSNGLMAGIGGVIHKKKGEKLFPVLGVETSERQQKLNSAFREIDNQKNIAYSLSLKYDTSKCSFI